MSFAGCFQHTIKASAASSAAVGRVVARGRRHWGLLLDFIFVSVVNISLVKRWHPDRCSVAGNSNNVEEANEKFHAVQEAYSVLSDANRRLLYDVGIHDSNDDDDKNGMADFLSEMATMMRQNKTNENTETGFEELKDLFEEMVENDINSLDSSSETIGFTTTSLFQSYGDNSSSTNKRCSLGMSKSTITVEDPSTFKLSVQGFCLGTNIMDDAKRTGCAREGRGAKHGYKHKTSRNGISIRD